MNQMNKIKAALETAGIRSRIWEGNSTTRLYIELRDIAALTSSQRRDVERRGGAYCEMDGDEVLVQHLASTAEETVIAALTAAGLAAR